MDNLALIYPCAQLRTTWVDQRREWGGEDVHIDGASQPKKDRGEDAATPEGWQAWLDRLAREGNEAVALPPERVHATALWLVETFAEEPQDGRGVADQVPASALRVASAATVLSDAVWVRHVGATQLRHRLTDQLREAGGHIGYGVRPSARRRGYATWMLQETLRLAHLMGLDEVMISCSEDNLGSAKVIESQGGQLNGILDTWLGRARIYTVPTHTSP